MADKKQEPDQLGTLQAAQLPAVTICRDVYGGTLAIREKGETYLPRFPKEESDAYADRLRRAVLYNGMTRAVRAYTGMVMRKPLDLSGITDSGVLDHLRNIDQAGREIDGFATDAFCDEMVDGHRVILVDMPPAATAARNRAEEGVRSPYWVDIPKSSILRFAVERINGKLVLTRFAYQYDSVEPDGEFGDKVVMGVREYTLGQVSLADGGQPQMAVTYREWRKDPKKQQDGWVEIAVPDPVLRVSASVPMTRIPVAVCYAARARMLVSEPPLLDLAHENIRHYQMRSDRDTALSIGCVPIFVEIGGDDKAATAWGPSVMLRVPQGGDLKVVETSGSSFDATRDELRDIEQRMAAMSVAMLQRDTRAAETAEARRIDKSENDASLQTAADGLEDGLNQALDLHFEWLGLDRGEQAIRVNRDFEKMLLTPQQATELRNALNDGRISLETYWQCLIDGEWLPDGFDPETEKTMLEAPDLPAAPAPRVAA